MCILLIVTGLAYLWHYIPEGPFFGVQPPETFQVENGWQVYNELTGWGLLFSGFTTLTFVLVLRKFDKSIVKYLLYVVSALFLSLVLSSMLAGVAELFYYS